MTTLTTSTAGERAFGPLRRDGRRVLYSMGNVGDARVFEAWGGSAFFDALPVTYTPALHEAETLAKMDEAVRVGAQAVEEFIAWGTVEPSPGRWDWSVHVRNAEAAHQRGLGYVVCGLLHVRPRQGRTDPRYPQTVCVEHGRATEFMSMFADETVEAFDLFHAQLAANLGGAVELVRYGSPYDYCEAYYPSGVGNQVFPVDHIHEGFWAGEDVARAHFRTSMERAYGGDLDAVNRTWGTSYRSFAELGYPDDVSPERHRYDFITWYQEALSERTGLLFDAIRRHFPDTPMLMNFGWAYEKVVFGTDPVSLVRESAKRRIEVRTPVGPLVSFLYVKHITTAARFGNPPGLSSEPANGEQPESSIALTLFKDLTCGVEWHFDYGLNYARVPQLYATARELWRDGVYPIVETALFFPTTHHRLLPREPVELRVEANFLGPDGDTGFPGFPDGLLSFAESLRSVADYDVVDEPLIAGGALDSYRLLVWPIGDVVLRSTLDAILEWVRAGGVLVVSDADVVRTLEGEAEPPFGTGATGPVTQLGEGCVVRTPRSGVGVQSWRRDLLACGDAYNPGCNPAFAAWLAAARDLLAVRAEPGQLEHALNLLTTQVEHPGVLASRFADGLLLHNTTPGALTVTPVGSTDPVDLAPFAIHWLPQER